MPNTTKLGATPLARRPYMVLAHKWDSNPQVTTFLKYGIDFVTNPGDVDPNNNDGRGAPSTWFITPGVVWERGNIDYSLESTFSSTLGLDSRSDYTVLVRPGVKWILPSRLTFNSHSRWTIRVSVYASYGSDGADFGTSTRLQTDFDFKAFIKRMPWPKLPTPVSRLF